MKRIVKRIWLIVAALGFASAALAQTPPPPTSASTSVSGSLHHSSGLAKPPAGLAPAGPTRLDHSNASVQGNNTPTLPQIALHPGATIGSSVPMAGPGGTTRSATGN